MPISEAILDTGPLVAVLSGRDALHAWARRLFFDLPLPCLTCEAVLSETFFRLRRDPKAMMALGDMIDGAAFRVIPLGSLSTIGRYVIKYRVDFADACLVSLSEQFPNATVVTTDSRDFSVLRRFGSEPIPFIAPPS